MLIQKSILTTFVTLLSLSAAQAHLLVAQPSQFEANAGDTITVKTGLAEPLISYAYSRENLVAAGHAGTPAVADLTGGVVYADGTTAALAAADFKPVGEDPAKSLADEVQVKLTQAGATVIYTQMQFNSKTRPTITFAKTFLNWKGAEVAKNRVGTDDVLEIIVLNQTDVPLVGNAFTVQAFLRGKPLADAEISATYDGAPVKDGGEENDYLISKTDADGKATFTPDQANTWVVGIEYIDNDYKSGNPAYDQAGARYRSTILFPVNEK